MNEYIKKIDRIATKCTCSQSDGYAQIMRICEAIKEESEASENTIEYEMAIKALDTLKKIKEIIKEEESYPVSNSLNDPHPNEQDYNKVHAEKFDRIWKVIADSEKRKVTYFVYFAVSDFNDYVYLKEKITENTQTNISKFLDLIDDYGDLKSELDWSRLDENDRPKEAGCYQAVVEYRQTAEDDYCLSVISCVPVYLIVSEQVVENVSNSYPTTIWTGRNAQEATVMSETEKDLIAFIFENCHWCPLDDESGFDFKKNCVGFRENGCMECIYKNTDKLKGVYKA